MSMIRALFATLLALFTGHAFAADAAPKPTSVMTQTEMGWIRTDAKPAPAPAATPTADDDIEVYVDDEEYVEEEAGGEDEDLVGYSDLENADETRDVSHTKPQGK